MELQPMKRYRGPEYPTRDVLDAQPELLRLVPRRWQANAAVLTAMTALSLVGARQSTAADATPPVTLPAEARLGGDVLAPPLPMLPTRVAPITSHGDGIGTVLPGGIRNTVFLPENEARKIIAEELSKVGVQAKEDKLTLPFLAQPITGRTGLPALTDGGTEPKGDERLFITPMAPAVHFVRIAWPVVNSPLQLDGTDEERNISFEYVSQNDYESLFSKAPRPVEQRPPEYDIRAAANRLRMGLGNRPATGTYGVFYDPCVEVADVRENTSSKAVDEKAEQEQALMLARYELRQQVRDFIAWLKAEGVI